MTNDAETMSLVKLPTEILTNIAGNIPRKDDLSRLSRTCRSCRHRLLNQLYKQLILPVPLRPSRLRFFSELLATNTEGLRYVKSIAIVPKHGPLLAEEALIRDHEDDESAKDSTYLPNSEQSEMVNRFVRRLIEKITKNQVKSFRWGVLFMMEIQTLYLVHASQKNIAELSVPMSQQVGMEGPIFDNLSTLEFWWLDKSLQGGHWQFDSLVKSHPSLGNLQIGDSTLLTDDRYTRLIDLPRMEPILHAASDRRAADHIKQGVLLKIDNLHLCGLDVFGVRADRDSGVSSGTSFFAAAVNWDNLVSLHMESCVFYAGLELFNGVSSFRLINLQTFIIRHLGTSEGFERNLEIFLTRLPPLSNFQFLLSHGYTQQVEPILAHHGPTLKTLVWDQECCASHPITDDEVMGHLNVIARYCPRLESVGLAWKWRYWKYPAEFEDIMETAPSKYKLAPVYGELMGCWPPEDPPVTLSMPDAFTEAIKAMPKLKTIHIRGVPGTEQLCLETFPNEELYQALAEQLFSLLPTPRSVTTIGFNSAYYSDVKMGASHLYDPYPWKRYDFWKLRIFHLSRSAAKCDEPELIAKGVANDAEGICEDLDIFRRYWV